MGTEFYTDLIAQLGFMVEAGTISAKDLQLIKLTDDPNEAMEHIQAYIDRFYELKKKKRNPLWWLFEK